MAMLNDEVAILKAQSIEIDENTILIVTQQYHTEKNAQGKTDRAKSKYRWLARVFTKDDLKKTIDFYYSDAQRLQKSRWPNDPDPWYLCCGNDCSGAVVGKFFENKLKKTRSWEDGQKFLAGWQTQTANRVGAYNAGAVYPIENFKAENGDIVSLADKKALLAHVGQNLYHDHVMKSKLPPPSVQKAKTQAA